MALLLENASDLMVVVNRLGLVCYQSPSVGRILGYDSNELIGTSALTLIHADDIPATLKYFQTTPAPGTTLVFENRIRHKDGSWRTLESLVRVLPDGGAMINARDVTERNNAEYAEREQRAFTEALRDSAADIGATLDLQEVLRRILRHTGRVVPTFDAGTIMLIEGERAVIASYYGFDQRGLGERVRGLALDIEDTPNLRHMRDTGEPMFITDTLNYPGWRRELVAANWVRAFVGAPIIAGGEVLGFINLDSILPNVFTAAHAERLMAFAHQAAIAIKNARTYAGIVEQAAQLQKRVKESRAQLEIIMDATGEGVVYVENRIVRYVNPAMCRMLGSDANRLAGQTIDLIVAPITAPRTLRGILRALRRRETWRGELTLRRGYGTFPAGVTISAISAPREKPRRIVAIVRDVSEEKALETQKMRFIANASHELRNPVQLLENRLYMLKQSPERLPEHITALETTMDRLLSLLNDLLDTSRFEHGQLRLARVPLPVNALVVSAVHAQRPPASAARITLEASTPDEPLTIFGDELRLFQVLTNLLTNAIHYSREGGTVRVVGERDGSQHVRITVEDNGIGIPAEHLPNIFQPFYRVDERRVGTGLGLSIAQEIVRLHGGEIRVASVVGQGTRFTIRLPLAKNI